MTATAFQLFNDYNMEYGVVEVGMGGKLDATNILNNQVVSVISKISHDHHAFLGNTLEEIARHKAGILKPGVPYIINPANEDKVRNVIEEVAKEVGAGPVIHTDTTEMKTRLFASDMWGEFARGRTAAQQDNAVLAFLAVKEVLENHPDTPELDRIDSIRKLLPDLENKTFPGRYQRVSAESVFGAKDDGYFGKEVLIDGAHNPDAAEALSLYVGEYFRKDYNKIPPKGYDPRTGWPVTWVMAMTEGKQVDQVLAKLIRDGDNVVITTFGPVDGMPWVKPMDPKDVLSAVEKLHRNNVTAIAMLERGAHRALIAAKYLAAPSVPIVLTGSLYLVGEFLRERAALDENPSTIDRELISQQERDRIYRLPPKVPTNEETEHRSATVLAEERRKQELQEHIETLDKELKRLEAEQPALK